MGKNHVRALAVLLTAGMVAVGCGSDDSDDAAAPEGGAQTSAAAGGGTSLAGVCPNPLVVQTDWFPEPEHGYTYQLIGPGGEIDASKGTYSGPLGDTGIDMEIRAGGPFIGFQDSTSQMYSDDSIFLGYVDSADQIRSSQELPTKAVMAPLDKSPQVVYWNADKYDFKSFEDIRNSGQKVLYFETASWMDYMLAEGKLNQAQVDGSYDGSPAQFVAADGAVVQQGFVSNEIFKYENEIPEFNKPLEFLFVHDAGFQFYQSALAVRADVLEERRACLEAVVPMFQQAMVDYFADPEPVNTELLNIVEQFATFWTLTEAGVADAVEKMTEYDLVTNGSNDTVGDFDVPRVEKHIADMVPLYREQGVNTMNPQVKAGDLVTNEFLDESIGLGG